MGKEMRKRRTNKDTGNCLNCGEYTQEHYWIPSAYMRKAYTIYYCDLKDREIKRIIKCKHWYKKDAMKEEKILCDFEKGREKCTDSNPTSV